jgi:C4-dicarboxylate-specific signal transduction histidine kinase
MPTKPKLTRLPNHFAFALTRDLFGVTDAFQIVRIFGEHASKLLGATQAKLSWPDQLNGFRDPIRVETIPTSSTTPNKKPLVKISEIRFSDGKAAFIKLDLYGPKSMKISKTDQAVLAETTALVDHVIRASQKQIQTEEFRRFESIRTLSAGIAHELNTPLNTLFFHLKSLTKQFPNEPRLEPARLSADRIRNVIAKFKTFAGDGDLGTERVPRLLSDILASVSNTFKSLDGSAEVALRMDSLKSAPLIDADATKLEAALLLLLQNSLDAFQRAKTTNPNIHIGFEIRKSKVRLKITDNGPGIPTESQAALFDPFYSTKEVNEGLGLGLSVARAIAFAHDGTLHLNPLSNLTQFVLELPISAAVPALKKGA